MTKGFLIADQSPITGIVETDWAEDTSKNLALSIASIYGKISSWVVFKSGEG
jgi:uncharacterized lipoprotein